MRIESMKGQPCPYKPITCQEGYCPDCAIFLRYHQRLEADFGKRLQRKTEIRLAGGILSGLDAGIQLER